jgi:hypothetical protein
MCGELQSLQAGGRCGLVARRDVFLGGTANFAIFCRRQSILYPSIEVGMDEAAFLKLATASFRNTLDTSSYVADLLGSNT